MSIRNDIMEGSVELNRIIAEEAKQRKPEYVCKFTNIAGTEYWVPPPRR